MESPALNPLVLKSTCQAGVCQPLSLSQPRRATSEIARMQKSGGAGYRRAERDMALLKEKCCPQTVAGESRVRSPVPEEEKLVQSHGRDFPPSCDSCVESLSGNITQVGACLGRKGKELRTSLCSFPKYGSLFSDS